MKLFVVAIRDAALEAFMRPVFVPSIGAAVRSFQDEVNSAESPLKKHPEDYDLYELATFDDSDGSFVQMTPIKLAVGANMVRGD